MTPPRYALVSVSDKTGILEFAQGLVALGFRILSTGGTAAYLAQNGVAVTKVEDYTGFPEMMDGRLKTLHPKIHGGILSRRQVAQDMAALETHGIVRIDVVAVNLYPFRETAAKPGIHLDEVVEQIDIGGPSMVRAAAKNHRDVLVVVEPSGYGRVLEALRSGQITAELRYDLCCRALEHTAAYDNTIAQELRARDPAHAGAKALPAFVGLSLRLHEPMRYGENPHQRAGLYGPAGAEPAGMLAAQQLGGKELSYNNVMDTDAAWAIVSEFSDTAAVIIKHANPCGAACTGPLAEVYERARAVDPTSAFGGIVAFNRPVDTTTARILTETFLEVIAAPGFDAEALAVLQAKKNLRLLRVPAGEPGADALEFRRVWGGYLVQDRDTGAANVRASKVVTKRAPTAAEWEALEFAWKIVKHVKSNAIVYAFKDRLGAVGAGQMSRVDSSKIAATKATAPLTGSALASDAFFPFRDGVDAAAQAGATAVIQPGGSVRDAEVIAAADDHGMAMVFTGMRHFRH